MFPRLVGIFFVSFILAACATPVASPTPTPRPNATAAPALRATEPVATPTATAAAIDASTSNAPVGYLSGHVTIGPLQPVQRAGVPPASPAPEVYAARSIDIFQADGATLVANLKINSDGTYHIALSPGDYIVALARSGIDRARGLPKTITIESGKPVQLDIDVDTGIR
jgi:hypothetical protein